MESIKRVMGLVIGYIFYRGNTFRRSYEVERWNNVLGEAGKNSCLNDPQYITHPEKITLGGGVYVNSGSIIMAHGGGSVGRFTIIGPGVMIFSVGHDYSKSGKELRDCQILSPVYIGVNCWIGGGAVILPGVSIGGNCVIGAGSIVSRSIPDNTIAVGNPCRVVRERFG